MPSGAIRHDENFDLETRQKKPLTLLRRQTLCGLFDECAGAGKTGKILRRDAPMGSFYRDLCTRIEGEATELGLVDQGQTENGTRLD
jgi:hypothetical protein